jgi:hypothetical protein
VEQKTTQRTPETTQANFFHFLIFTELFLHNYAVALKIKAAPGKPEPPVYP